MTKRFRRRVFGWLHRLLTGASMLSTALLLATLVLWVITWTHYVWIEEHHLGNLSFAHGRLEWMTSAGGDNWTFNGGWFAGQPMTAAQDGVVNGPADLSFEEWGFGIVHGKFRRWPGNYWIFKVPAWFAGVILLAFSAPWVISWRRRRGTGRRVRNGLCPACGYDLRAHRRGDKCPECGRPVFLQPET